MGIKKFYLEKLNITEEFFFGTEIKSENYFTTHVSKIKYLNKKEVAEERNLKDNLINSNRCFCWILFAQQIFSMKYTMRIYIIKRIRFHQMRTKTNFIHELKFKVEFIRRFSKMYEARFSKTNYIFDKCNFWKFI